jgi:hypothetical protein
MIRGNHIKTAGRLFEWTHEHMFPCWLQPQSPLYTLSTLQMEAVWQYRGDSPAARMMAKFVYEDRSLILPVKTERSWRTVVLVRRPSRRPKMRAVNIPVAYVHPLADSPLGGALPYHLDARVHADTWTTVRLPIYAADSGRSRHLS